MLSIMFIIIATIVASLLIAFEAERQRRAKHRARTTGLLLSIRLMPYEGAALVRAER